MSEPRVDEPRANSRAPEVHSEDLLGPRGELIIIHNEERYTLRITANRKLILTK